MKDYALAVSLLLLTACSSPADIDWKSKTGRYSLDDAKRELGRPESCVSLDDAGTACSWLTGKAGESIDKLILTFGRDGQLATSNHVHF